jgi:hypothetical protein
LKRSPPEPNPERCFFCDSNSRGHSDQLQSNHLNVLDRAGHRLGRHHGKQLDQQTFDVVESLIVRHEVRVGLKIRGKRGENGPGTDVMISKIFSPNFLVKKIGKK